MRKGLNWGEKKKKKKKKNTTKKKKKKNKKCSRFPQKPPQFVGRPPPHGDGARGARESSS